MIYPCIEQFEYFLGRIVRHLLLVDLESFMRGPVSLPYSGGNKYPSLHSTHHDTDMKEKECWFRGSAVKNCSKRLISNYLLQTASSPPYAVISCRSSKSSTRHRRRCELRISVSTVVLVYSCIVLSGIQRTVDVAGVVADNLLDGTLGLEVVQGLACERAVDLQAIDEDGDGDETVGLYILVETLLEGLVEDDGVDGLVLHCSRKSTLALGLLVAGSLGAGVSWMGGWMRACAFQRSFMCVVDARRGWRRDFAYPCPWTTSSFVFRREAF